MDTSKYTSRKFPFMGGSVERTVNDPLATVAWRQDANGPTECILVSIDGKKEFVTMEQYKLSGAAKRINGKLIVVSLRPHGLRRGPRMARLMRGYYCYTW